LVTTVVGELVGFSVTSIVGVAVGKADGVIVGEAVGEEVVAIVGCSETASVGVAVGEAVGESGAGSELP